MATEPDTIYLDEGQRPYLRVRSVGASAGRNSNGHGVELQQLDPADGSEVGEPIRLTDRGARALEILLRKARHGALLAVALTVLAGPAEPPAEMLGMAMALPVQVLSFAGRRRWWERLIRWWTQPNGRGTK